jgi:hypothetical protein
VDAPSQAREIFRIVVARSRMLPSVRPLMQRWSAAGLVWEFAGRVHHTQSVLEALWTALVFPTPSRRPLRHTLLPFALRPRELAYITPPRPELPWRDLTTARRTAFQFDRQLASLGRSRWPASLLPARDGTALLHRRTRRGVAPTFFPRRLLQLGATIWRGALETGSR